MEQEKKELSFMLTFTGEQLEFMANQENKKAVKVLFRIIENAQLESTVQKVGMIRLRLSTGQSAVADTELGRIIGCGKGAARNVIKKLNDAGFIKTKYGHPMCVHSVLCLKGWHDETLVLVNPEAKDSHSVL